MKIATITYRGPGRTIHPELGELVPDEAREIPERDVPAAQAAQAAGLPLEIAYAEAQPVETSAQEASPARGEGRSRRDGARTKAAPANEEE